MQFRSRCAQQLDHAVTDAAAAMYREAGRLVNDKQALVFKQDLPFQVSNLAGCRRIRTRINPGWRDPDLVAGEELVFGPHPAAIHPYLTTAQNPV